MSKWENLTFSNHFMFRVVMEDKELSKGLLERVLDINIKELQALEPEKSLEAKLSSKGVRLDYYIEDAEGVAYDLEMQAINVDKKSLGRRARYYQSLMDIDALKKNEPYSKLRKSLVVFICTFDPFTDNLGRYSFENLCLENRFLTLEDGCHKVFLNTKGKRDGLSKDLQNLMDYINGAEPEDDFTKSLDQAVIAQRQDKIMGELYMTYVQTLMEEYNRGVAEQKKETDKAKAEAAEAERKLADSEKKNLQNILDFVAGGYIPIEVGADKAGMSVEAFSQALEEYKSSGTVLEK